jgi:hypothetical protein
MATQYNIDKVTYGVSGWGNILSDTIQSVSLGASSDSSFTVPSSAALGVPGANINKFIARIRVFGNSKTVWFAMNATAEVPQGMAGVWAATTSEILLPDNGYYVRAGDVLHFYSTAVADLSVAFYAIQSN